MLIERNVNDEIVIKHPKTVSKFGIQRLIDYASYLESTAGAKAKQKDVDKLADEVNENWWTNNQGRFIK